MPAFSVIPDAQTGTTASASSATYVLIPHPPWRLLPSSLLTSTGVQNCNTLSFVLLLTAVSSCFILRPSPHTAHAKPQGKPGSLTSRLALPLTLWNMSLILDLPGRPVLAFFSVPFLFLDSGIQGALSRFLFLDQGFREQDVLG